MLKLNFIGEVLKDWTKNELSSGAFEYTVRLAVIEPYTDKDGKPASNRTMVITKVYRNAERAVNFESNLKPGMCVYASVDMPKAESGKNPSTNAIYGYFSANRCSIFQFLGTQKAEHFIRLQAVGGITQNATINDLKTDVNKKAINFSVACSERLAGTDANGYPNQNTVFVNGGIFRETDKCGVAQYLTKGTKVYVEGRPVVRIGVDTEGNGRTYFNAEFTNVEFVGGNKKADADELPAEHVTEKNGFYRPSYGDDMPF